jgi:hypothetical protein
MVIIIITMFMVTTMFIITTMFMVTTSSTIGQACYFLTDYWQMSN